MHAVDIGIYSVIGVLVLAAAVGPAVRDSADALPGPASTLRDAAHGPDPARDAPVVVELPPRDDDRRPDGERGDDDGGDDDDNDHEDDDHDGGGKKGRRGKG